MVGGDVLLLAAVVELVVELDALAAVHQAVALDLEAARDLAVDGAAARGLRPTSSRASGTSDVPCIVGSPA